MYACECTLPFRLGASTHASASTDAARTSTVPPFDFQVSATFSRNVPWIDVMQTAANECGKDDEI